MEVLYKKLYAKYIRLKGNKETEMDRINRDQEVKTAEFMKSAEDFIDILMDEKTKLQAEIDVLRDELSSLRSAKDQEHIDYEKLLFEERQKNRLLSMEVERLQKLQQDGSLNDADLQNIPPFSAVKSRESTRSSSRKRTRYSRETEAALASPSSESRKSSIKQTRYLREIESVLVSVSDDNQMEHLQERDLSLALLKEPISSMDPKLPICCRRNLDGIGPCDCLFQILVECLTDMKVSIIDQSEGLCITAFHESSGYSFSLTWINKAAAEEAVLLYRVLSLGTLKRLAPEWMKEVVMFRSNMCPVFFEKVSRVLNL